MKASLLYRISLLLISLAINIPQDCHSQTDSKSPAHVSNNAGTTVANNSAGRDLNVTVVQGWDLSRQALMGPGDPTRTPKETVPIGAIDLLVEQIRTDKHFANIIVKLTGAAGYLDVASALSDLKTAVDLGSGHAALLRALVLWNGWWGEAKNPQDARRLFEIAADRGHPGAQHLLQIRHWNGTEGFTLDKTKSTLYLQKLSDNEYADRELRASATLWLANRTLDGDGTSKDVCKGVRLTVVAAELGNVIAMRNMGYERKNQKRCSPIDAAQALRWFERAAGSGDSISSVEAGYIHHFGHAGKRDYFSAEKFYQLAASPEADVQLAWIYGKGLATNSGQPDYSKSLAYARRAAIAGNSSAMINVGLHFEYGLGVDQNLREAFRWYEKAGNAGNMRGIVNQASAVLNSCVSSELMPDWHSALQGVAANSKTDLSTQNAALLHLGNAYRSGLGGLSIDTRQAIRYYERACNSGSSEACLRLSEQSGVKLSPAQTESARRSEQEALKTEGAPCARTISSRSQDPDTFP